MLKVIWVSSTRCSLHDWVPAYEWAEELEKRQRFVLVPILCPVSNMKRFPAVAGWTGVMTMLQIAALFIVVKVTGASRIYLLICISDILVKPETYNSTYLQTVRIKLVQFIHIYRPNNRVKTFCTLRCGTRCMTIHAKADEKNIAYINKSKHNQSIQWIQWS